MVDFRRILIIPASILLFSLPFVLLMIAFQAEMLASQAEVLAIDSGYSYFIACNLIGFFTGIAGAAASSKLVQLTREKIAWRARILTLCLTIFMFFIITQAYVAINLPREYVRLPFLNRVLIAPRLAFYVAIDWFGGIGNYIFATQLCYAGIYTMIVVILGGVN